MRQESGHLSQRLDMSSIVDNRCKGCPVILSEEIGGVALSEIVCRNRFVSVYDELGCKKGYIDEDKILHISSAGDFTYQD